MAVKAFVLIQTEIEVATTKEVVAALRKIGAEIQTVDRVTGPYDIIVTANGRNLNKISALVEEEIDAIPSVYKTVTCLVI